MDPAFPVAALLATLAARQAGEALLRRSRRGPRGAGGTSLLCWHAAYFAILASALWRLIEAPAAAQAGLGYGVMVGGILLRFAALREIGVFYHPLILIRGNHRLIDTGPYRWLRHPLHLGLHLEMAGLALIADVAPAWICLALSLAVLAWRNSREERALERRFASYRDYRRRAWDVIDLLPRGRR